VTTFELACVVSAVLLVLAFLGLVADTFFATPDHVDARRRNPRSHAHRTR
jgi:hypothetical protein